MAPRGGDPALHRQFEEATIGQARLQVHQARRLRAGGLGEVEELAQRGRAHALPLGLLEPLQQHDAGRPGEQSATGGGHGQDGQVHDDGSGAEGEAGQPRDQAQQCPSIDHWLSFGWSTPIPERVSGRLRTDWGRVP